MINLKHILLFLLPIYTLNSQIVKKEIGNLYMENIPEIPDSIKNRVDQYLHVRSCSINDWLANGEGILISTRFCNTTQLHIVKEKGGFRKQITFFDEPVSSARVCPDPKKNAFLFRMDKGGGEMYQIYYFDLENGKYFLVTDGKSRNGTPLWSNKGDKFVYYSTKRNGRDWDIYITEIGEKDTTYPVLEEGGFWYPLDFSPDDKKLLLGKYVSANESYIYVLNLETKELLQINPSEEKIAYEGAVFGKTGKGIFYVCDEGSEFKNIFYYELKTGKKINLTRKIKWDVDEIEISRKRDILAFTVNNNGYSDLYLMDLKSKKYKKIKSIPKGIIYNLKFHPFEKKLAFVLNTPKSPGDVYVLDVKKMKIERWTYSEVGGLNTEKFVEPELFYYPTFDSLNGKPRMIPAFLYKPKDSKPPYPVLILIHGGPESQYRPYFSSMIQFYVNELKIAVIAPNVRGSSGYGKTYLKLDNWYKREDAVKDIGKLIEWIERNPELDEKRIAVTGASYGGYMSLATMTHFSDKLRCGIDIVGISNFVTFLENTKEYRRDLRRKEYGDERIPEMREFLIKISPLTNASKIKVPLLVVHGKNDPRVPVGEAFQIIERVRKNNVPVWFLLAYDEGHGFRKKKNRDFMYYTIVMFLKEYLLK